MSRNAAYRVWAPLRDERGGAQRAGRGLAAAALTILLFATVAFPPDAKAQIAMPDVKLTPRNVYQVTYQQPSLQGQPALAASGASVFGVWISNDEADHVGIGWLFSADAGNDWTTGAPLTSYFPGGFVGGTPTASLDRTGTAQILLGGTFFYRSTSAPFPSFGPAVLTQSTVRPDLVSMASDPVSGYAYACYTGKNPSNDGYPHLSYPIRFIRSADGGQTWDPPVTLSSVYSDGSNLVVGPDGELYVSWMDYQQGRLVGRKSTDRGGSFSPEFTIATPLDNLGARMKGWSDPDLNITRYNPWYVIGSNLYTPNYPRITVDGSPGPTRGRVYAVWAEHAAGAPAPAAIQTSEVEDNSSFSTANVMAMNTDWTGFLVGYEFGDDDLDIFAFDGQAGQAIQFWGELLDDGYLSPVSPSFPWVMYGTRPDGSVVSIYQGPMIRATVSPPVRPSIITLPHTGRYYIAVQTSGPQPLFYGMHLREYQIAPGSVALDMRDIVIASSADGGQTWSPPRRVNHGPGDSDQAMPNVAVDEHGRVYVAWYDRRGSALADSVNAYAAVSLDGGLTFGPDLKLSSAPSYWSGGPGAGGYGDYVGDRIAVAAGDNYGVVAWTDFRNGSGAVQPGDPDVYAARIVNDVPTAVLDVSDFTAAPSDSGVRLNWVVNDARRVAGLRVFRSEAGDGELPLGEGDLQPTRAGVGEFVDRTARAGNAYAYRLRVLRGATADWLGPVTVAMSVRLAALAWRAAWPNPFAHRTTVKLAVPRAAEGTVRVYDVQGKEVRTLAAGRFEPGERDIEWDGRDASGGMAAPGLYFVAAQVGGAKARVRVARVP